MLAEEIKKRMFAAMKAKRTVEKEILRVALGEIQTEEARGDAGPEVAERVVKKLVKSNRETLENTADAAARATLEEELEILESLLPKALGVDAIVVLLEPVAAAIREAKADGPATGIAMKHLRAAGAAVEGRDVTLAVRRLREPGS